MAVYNNLTFLKKINLFLGEILPLQLLRHIPFLRAVLNYSITAFGGPQVAVGLMQHRFVEKRKDVTAEELMEYNAFCQLLPGASSTQTIILIAYKRGGVILAFFTLLIWILPATIIMGSLAILVTHFEFKGTLKSLQFLQPMAVGFLVSAALLLYKKAIKSTITLSIFICTAIITFIGFKTPWTIPITIVLAGIVTNFSNKRIPDDGAAPKKVNWNSLFIFIVLFAMAGFLSEEATRQNWTYRKAFNLFENNYRFGSLVFGGGDVLMPIMYEQYVTRPQSAIVKKNKRDVLKMTSEEFLTGSGLVRAIPGPIFSIASYTGAISFKDKGLIGQIVGAIIGSIGVFLPSFLIVLFFFPIWQKLKKFAVFYRSLEGIYAAIVGIMTGASIFLIKDLYHEIEFGMPLHYMSYLFVFITSTFLIYKQKLSPQWIAISCIFLGICWTFFQ
ncbi:MAG: chromate efflux transporter [Chitinophagia bacterium]|jgi:chromate transporter|nr:chromate efflux transporter [Chitinophagia bacterium]